MKIGIFTGGTSVRSKNIFANISRYATGKHEIRKVSSSGKMNVLGGYTGISLCAKFWNLCSQTSYTVFIAIVLKLCRYIDCVSKFCKT